MEEIVIGKLPLPNVDRVKKLQKLICTYIDEKNNTLKVLNNVDLNETIEKKYLYNEVKSTKSFLQDILNDLCYVFEYKDDVKEEPNVNLYK